MILLFSLCLLALYFILNHRPSILQALDRLLPSALFSAASFPPGTPLERILRSLEETTPAPLNDAFGFLQAQLRLGHTFPTALDHFCRQYPTPLVQRVTFLLESSYRTGAPLNEVYKNVAEDAFLAQSLDEERQNLFAIQKYTLFAGVVLVPSVLGSLYSWSAPSNLSNAIWLGLHIYLFFFSVLAALFICSVKRDLSKAAYYSAIFLSVCFASFYITAGHFTVFF